MADVAATSRIRWGRAWAVLLGLLVLELPLESIAQETAATPIAIVVHMDTSIDDLSLQELRNIFLANQQFWPDRTRITLMMRAPKSDERDFVLDRIYQMDEAQFRQYWIAKMFRAEVPSGPKIVFQQRHGARAGHRYPGLDFLHQVRRGHGRSPDRESRRETARG